MGYDFEPNNKKIDAFHLGAFSWPVLLQSFGTMFPFMQDIQWYAVFGVDERMPMGDSYPRVISNDGFRVTAAEAKMMAQMARNYVAIQRSLPDAHLGQGLANKQEGITRDMLVEALHEPRKPGAWPTKIRSDFVDAFERFAEFAEKSGGFRIW